MSVRAGFRGDKRFETRNEQRIDQLRVPPQSIEAEQAVLGGLMLAPDSWDRIADQLGDNDFYRRDHQLIFRAIRELAEKNRPFDAVTLGEWFESQGLSEQVAGGAYLIELASTTPSAANITAYAEIVRDKAILRQLIDVGTGIVNDGFQPDGRDSSEILEEAERQVLAIAQASSAGKTDFTPVTKALSEAFDTLQTRYTNGSGVTGLSTGYTELDMMTAGLQKTDLIILAARPAMGKTTLALNMAEYAAFRSKIAGGGVLDGNVGLAAGDAPDFLGRPRECAAPAYRPARGRGLEPRDQRDPHSCARSRSSSTTTPGLSPVKLSRQGAPPQARARPGPDRHRLPAADVGRRATARTARRKSRRSRVRSRAWPRNCKCR